MSTHRVSCGKKLTFDLIAEVHHTGLLQELDQSLRALLEGEAVQRGFLGRLKCGAQLLDALILHHDVWAVQHL